MTNRNVLRARHGALMAALVLALGACKGGDTAPATATAPEAASPWPRNAAATASASR